MMDAYKGKRVFVTGHSGFKGQWLVKKLQALGAEVFGFSLHVTDAGSHGDVRNAADLWWALRRAAPDFVFHLAAQAFVPIGYEQPLATFEINTIGTVNLLEALRRWRRPCAVVIVTTDKVYGESPVPATEQTKLVGRCPYSASKVAAEHAVMAYRASFLSSLGIAIATARAGNVIGGEDFGPGRLVPNAIRALREGQPIPVYNPKAVRPWQYVEDVIDGYLRLGLSLVGHSLVGVDPFQIDHGAWNFGPMIHHTVEEVVQALIRAWGSGEWTLTRTDLHETSELRIDSLKARSVLGWRPRWGFEDMIKETVEWYRSNPA